MQWDVSRAFNLLLKQRMEEQSIDLGVPRLSVSMEARSEDRMEPTEGTDLSFGDAQTSDGEDQSKKKPEPPKPAPRPTQAEVKRDERERNVPTSRTEHLTQGEPRSNTYARTNAESDDE